MKRPTDYDESGFSNELDGLLAMARATAFAHADASQCGTQEDFRMVRELESKLYEHRCFFLWRWNGQPKD